MGKFIDLTGQRFGNLIVVAPIRNEGEKIKWKCVCDCDAIIITRGSNLRSGATQSCGCSRKRIREDITGKRYGRLLAVKWFRDSNDNVMWLCKCDCGRETTVKITDLKRGHKHSCGCLHDELVRERFKKHGGSSSRLYRIWNGVKTRCTNDKRNEYLRYGAKGITVCQDWLYDFIAFRDWALANGYTDEMTLDRIAPDGIYEPENCQWLSKSDHAKKRKQIKKPARSGRKTSKTKQVRRRQVSKGLSAAGIKMKGEFCMNRLTARNEEGGAYFPTCFEDPCGGGGCAREDCDFIVQVCEKLCTLEEKEERASSVPPCMDCRRHELGEGVWGALTAEEKIERIMNVACELCHKPYVTEDEDELYEVCDKCPLAALVEQWAKEERV